MQRLGIRGCGGVFVLIVIFSSTLGLRQAGGAVVELPASAALPITNASGPGFVVRTVQASAAYNVENSLSRALKQLAGTLTDPSGGLITNVARPGPEPGGAYNREVISFEKDGLTIDTLDPSGSWNWMSFMTDFFPGIPGEEGEVTRFSLEAVALVELPAGATTLAVGAGVDRTDANDDDGCAVFIGANPRDAFAAKILEFQRAGSDPRGVNQYWENQFTVNAPVAGVYPFRIVYWQTGKGANLQFYVVTGSGERILVNDPADTRSPRAFRNSADPRFNRPYAGLVSPVPGSAGVGSSAPVEAVLFDGEPSTAVTNSIRMFLNNTEVKPLQITRAGPMTTVRFTPGSAGWTRANNSVRLLFGDSANQSYTNEWSFTAGNLGMTVTGQWDFDQGDLRATVGKPLTYFDPTFDGPTGSSTNKTTFGSCSAMGISLINGKDAMVIRVPGDLDRRVGYVMDHGIAPNGGGTKVNQYTLIMDVMVGTSGPEAAALLQIDSTENTTDGDLFWQYNQFGQGVDGYKGKGTFTPGEWHRFVAAYDEAADPPVVTKYLDGIKQDDWTALQGLDATRRALLPTAILFGDGDQDERRTMWVNSIQIRAGKLSDAQCMLMGAPDGNPIPIALPTSTVSGQWDFEFGDLTASVGANLQYFDPGFDGPDLGLGSGTGFGTCSEMGVPSINGVDAKIMRVPGDLDRRIGYVMTHRIPPNGGGTKVNQYTLIMDVLVDTNGPAAASLLQIDSLDNTTEGDLFWLGNNFGEGTDGYNGTGAFTAGQWHRVAAAYDEAATPPVVRKYVDGVLQDNWTANQGLDAQRRALLPTAILFADGDENSRRKMWVKSIQIRSDALSHAELESLGKPTGAAIPLVLNVPSGTPPALAISRTGSQLNLSWPADATGYTLESSDSIAADNWQPVPGVNGNSAVVVIGNANALFRLRK